MELPTLDSYSLDVACGSSPLTFTYKLSRRVKATASMQREHEESMKRADNSTHKQVLTASVFESVDCVGQEADTAEETCTLLFVDLLVIPYADGD